MGEPAGTPFKGITSSETAMGAWIMLGTLFGLIAVVYAVVLRYDPQARALPGESKARSANLSAGQVTDE